MEIGLGRNNINRETTKKKRLKNMKKTCPKPIVRFPYVDGYCDYHDIEFAKNDYEFVFGRGKICAKEVAFDGNYWGLFWVRGHKPTNKEIRKMIGDAGFEDNEYSSRFN